ncbi:MAG: hypothetical protein P1U74_01040 [Legionellaceae bacterium]|nr:hypothetical protein [Legionellaceae bacterium]
MEEKRTIDKEQGDSQVYSAIINDIGLQAEQAIDLTEGTFITLSTSTILIPKFCLLLPEVIKESAATLPHASIIDQSWNCLDGACLVVAGIGQLVNKSYTPKANTVKGASNVGSGVQLLWLTAIGSGPLGFVIGTGVGFAHSVYDTLKTIRRMHEPSYWLEDTNNKLLFLNDKKKTLELEIKQLNLSLKESPDGKTRDLQEWLVSRKSCRLEKTILDIEILQSDIEEYETNNSFTERLNEKITKELKDKLYNNLMTGSAMTGMALLLVPGGQVAGLALVAVAAAMFAYKYKGLLEPLWKCLFSDKDPDCLDEQDEDRKFKEAEGILPKATGDIISDDDSTMTEDETLRQGPSSRM